MTEPSHILVTGGAGFIGSHLVDRLLKDDHLVTVIDDCSTGSFDNLDHARKNPNLTLVSSTVSACSDLEETVAKSDYVYHLAAAVGVELVVNSPINTIHTNLHESEAILKAASKTQTPVLLTSTSEVYGKSKKHAFDEEDDLLIGPPHLGRWSYACSKLMDEFLAMAYAQEYATPVTIVRLFNTVGPRQTGRYGMVVPRFIEAALTDKPLKVYGDGTQTRCFCFVDDTVEALLRLSSCEAARGKVFNVGSAEEVSILDLARTIIETLGSRSRIEHVPYSEAYAPGFEDMLRRKPIVDKLFDHTRFRPRTPLREIIATTAAAARERLDVSG